MDICVDSNILIYNLNEFSSFHDDASNTIAKLRMSGANFYIFPQNLIEFWAVTTRPVSSNGLGLTPPEIIDAIFQIKALFHLIPETPDIYPEWERLVTKHSVSGKNVHDARLVAQMNVHGIDSILTFNVKDFARFGNINTVEPESV